MAHFTMRSARGVHREMSGYAEGEYREMQRELTENAEGVYREMQRKFTGKNRGSLQRNAE